jgi:hypothetical protein
MKGKIVEENSTNKLAIVTTFFMLTTAALAFLTFDAYAGKYQISKANYICTKIEQVGKNLDDVRCVQYTVSKYSKEAISLNGASALLASK